MDDDIVSNSNVVVVDDDIVSNSNAAVVNDNNLANFKCRRSDYRFLHESNIGVLIADIKLYFGKYFGSNIYFILFFFKIMYFRTKLFLFPN